VPMIGAALKAERVRGRPAASSEAIERWSKWVLGEADRIDPVKTARFLKGRPRRIGGGSL
jgi:hypothetical protein